MNTLSQIVCLVIRTFLSWSDWNTIEYHWRKSGNTFLAEYSLWFVLTAVRVGLVEVWRGGWLNGELGHWHLTCHWVSRTQATHATASVFSMRAHLENREERVVFFTYLVCRLVCLILLVSQLYFKWWKLSLWLICNLSVEASGTKVKLTYNWLDVCMYCMHK